MKHELNPATQNRPLSVRTQLRIAFLIVFVVLLFSAFLIDNRLRVINDKSTEIAENWMPSTIAINAINTATSDYRVAEGLHILSTDASSMDHYEKDMARLTGEISEWCAKYKPLISSEEERALYQSFTRKYDQYLEASQQTIAASRHNDNTNAAAKLKKSGDLFNDMSDELIKLVKLNQRGGETASLEGDELYADSRQILYWLGGSVFLLVMVLPWVLERRIVPREHRPTHSRAQQLLTLHYRKPTALLIVVSAINVISVSVISHHLFTGMTVAVESEQLAAVRSAVAYDLKSTEHKALSRAEAIADLPQARKLLAEKNREGLLSEFRAMFQTQSDKYGIVQAQFHLLPATSFLNLYAPEVFGEDLSKSRPMLLTANRELTPQSGFAITNTGPGIFGVAPVFDQKKEHIGSFETGLTLEGICDDLRYSLNLETAIFVDEDALWSNAKGIDKAIFSAQNRAGQYIRYYSTNAALMKQLVATADLNNPQAQYDREINGTHYGIVLTPIQDDSGEVKAVIAAATDLSALRSGEGRSVVWQALMAFISILILVGFILIVVRGVLWSSIKTMTRVAAEAKLANDEDKA